MKCKYCRNQMCLDDVDYNFAGIKYNYWVCDNCNTSAFEKIRYGKSIFVRFDKGEKE